MNDDNAFPDLDTLRQQEARLRPVVRALVTEDAAADVMQQTWLRVWQRPPRVAARVDGWLRRVAVRFALSHRREEARRRRREVAVADAAATATPSTAETVERLAMQRAVSEAVTALAEPYRTAVLLRFYHGLSVDEIAARTGTTAANVRQRTHRGLEAMRKDLERDLGPSWQRSPAVLAFLRPDAGGGPPVVLPLMLAMTKLRVASLVVGGLCLLAVGAALVPLAIGEPAPGVVGSPATASASLPGGVASAPPPSEVVPNVRTAAAATEMGTSAAAGRGEVVDGTGRSVAGATVRVRRADGAEWDVVGVTGADGVFAASSPLPSDIRAIDVAPPWGVLAVRLPSPEPAGAPAMLVVAPCRDQVLVVRDDNNLPLGGARAIVRVHGLVDFPRSLDDAAEITVAPTTGDAGGRHHWLRLPLGATVVTVSKAGYRPATVEIDAATAAELPVVLTKIDKGQRLVTGVVTDVRGRYVVGATVGLGSRETTTDAFGTFTLVLEAGAAVDPADVLFAVSEGWYPAQVPAFGARVLDISEGAIAHDLVLDHLALAIAGRVVDHAGRPKAGAAVYPWRLDQINENETAEDLAAGRRGEPLSLTGNLVRAFARTADDGTFTLRGMDRRGYQLHVYHREEGWAWTTPEIAGGSTNVEIRLPADLIGRVAGVVRDSAGRPAPGVKVTTCLDVFGTRGSTAAIGLRGSAETDGEGRFVIDDLPRHGVTLAFGGKDWVRSAIALDATAPLEDLRIVVLRRCHVRVQLADPALATARIEFVDVAGESVMIQEDRGTTTRITSSYLLHDGKTEVLAVSEAAVTLVVVVGPPDNPRQQRFAIALRPGEVNLVAR